MTDATATLTRTAAERGNGRVETAAERNKRLVQTFQTEVLHLGHYDRAREWAHDDLLIHLPPGIPRGLDHALQWFALCADWFTSLGIEIKMMIAEEDTVFQHIRLHFRHTGTYQGIPPTGKEFAIDGLAAFKLRDGKIAEHWGLYDMQSIPAQLGVDVPSWPGDATMTTEPSTASDVGAAYNPFDQAFLDNPHPVYQRIQADAPVCWSEAFESWLVTRYEDVAAAVTNPVFSSRNKSGPMPPMEVLEELERGFPMTGMLYSSDPPEHTRLRALVQEALSAELVASFEPTFRATANEVVDRFAGEGRADLYPQFVQPYTDHCILDTIGVPREDQPQVWEWQHTWESLFIPGREPEDQRAEARRVVQYQHYFAGMIEARRETPRRDLTTALIQARADRWEPLSTAEIVWELLELVGAAGNTTYGMANVLLKLFECPHRWRAQRHDPAALAAAIEEGMRVESPVLGCARETTEPVEIGGVTLPAGAPVLIAFAAANHDSSVFNEPERFDPEHVAEAPQVTLGRGPHYCVGARLARQMMTVAAEVLLDRLPGAHFEEGYVPQFYAPFPFLRSVSSLPVVWGSPDAG